jgi:hypothetical protein
MSIINLAIFLGIVIFALMTSSYLAGLILVFALSILEIVEYGMTHFMFLLMCELTLALFIIRETKLRKDNSPLLKYNPLYKNNVLPRKVQLIVCGVFLLAFVVRLVAFFHPTKVDSRSESKAEYQRSANAFINKVVIAHKKGEDYHSIARHNPFTNDVFVCKVVALLDSEYGRVDAMKLSISNAMQSAVVTRKEKLARLSADCLEESSNVVQRITAADIGEVNAKKMAIDFSTYYIKLHQKCSKAVANME